MANGVGTASAKPVADVLNPFLSGPILRTRSVVSDRKRRYDDTLTRRRRVVTIAAWMAATVSASFGVIEVTTRGMWPVALINGLAALSFALMPLLHRFGELLAPLALICTADVLLVVLGGWMGTHSGIAFFFLVAALVAVLELGAERMGVTCGVVSVSAGLIIMARILEPDRAKEQPEWASEISFTVSAIAACVTIGAMVWYAMREIEGAKEAVEREYQRSESLLTNILPTSVAARLKDESDTVIADKYDDASVLFADIAGYTERASQTTPAELVDFLNRLYREFDGLLERHGLEKIKTTGDCYMVVSGVPQPRPDHLEALARFALDLVESAGGLTDQAGQQVQIRVGLGLGPVVAGVVGTSRFFYDVWGDAVNVASRMESTCVEGRIQVAPEVYERLRSGFVFEERGEVSVKGKGVLRTWFLLGERAADLAAAG